MDEPKDLLSALEKARSSLRDARSFLWKAVGFAPEELKLKVQILAEETTDVQWRVEREKAELDTPNPAAVPPPDRPERD